MKGVCQKCDCWVRFPALHPLGDKWGECQLAPLKIAYPHQGSIAIQTVWAETREDSGCHSSVPRVEDVLAEFRTPLPLVAP